MSTCAYCETRIPRGREARSADGSVRCLVCYLETPPHERTGQYAPPVGVTYEEMVAGHCRALYRAAIGQFSYLPHSVEEVIDAREREQAITQTTTALIALCREKTLSDAQSDRQADGRTGASTGPEQGTEG